MKGLERFENRLKVSAVQVPIDLVRKAFQVHTGGIDHIAQPVQGGLADVCIAYPDILDPALPGQGRYVHHIFIESSGLGIGIGDTPAPVTCSRGHNILRGKVIIARLVRGGLRYLPVLAIETMKIAPGHCQRKGLGSRIEMLEGLFLHRVHLDYARIAVRYAEKLSLDVHLGSAPSAIVRKNNTFMGAGPALDCTISQFTIEIGFLYMGVCGRKRLFGPSTFPRYEQGATGSTQAGLDEFSAGCVHGHPVAIG
jgi:hypothetical protein